MKFFPTKNDFKLLVIVAAVMAGIVLSLYPAKHWLPFADDFPDWLTEVPLVVTLQQLSGFLFIVVIIWGTVLIARGLK